MAGPMPRNVSPLKGSGFASSAFLASAFFVAAFFVSAFFASGVFAGAEAWIETARRAQARASVERAAIMGTPPLRRDLMSEIEQPADDPGDRVEPGVALHVAERDRAVVLGGFGLDPELELRRAGPFFLLLPLVGEALAPELDPAQHGIELGRVEPDAADAAPVEE